MRFFVPTANDRAHARKMYEEIRHRIQSTGHRLASQAIFRIRLNRNGRPRIVAVGDSYPEAGGDPVLAIFQADSYYLLCTRRHGALQGDPMRIDEDQVSVVEEFDS